VVSRIEVGCVVLALTGSGIGAWVSIKEDIAVLKQNDVHTQETNIIFAEAVKGLDETLIGLSLNMGTMSANLSNVEKQMDKLERTVADGG
jgi:hypothetical protein